jgi:hypothetical protein
MPPKGIGHTFGPSCSNRAVQLSIQKFEYDQKCRAEDGIELVVEYDPKGEVQITCVALESIGRIISLQGMWRMILQRKKYRTNIEGTKLRQRIELMNKAAVMIQANYRRHRVISVIMDLRSNCVICQSVVRRFLTMKQMNHLRKARIFKDKKRLFLLRRIQHAEEDAAATKIRAAYVGYTARKNYRITMNRVVTCQCVARTIMAKREMQEMRQLHWAKKMKCATLIQATWRRCLASEYFTLIVSEVIVCQSAVRRKIATMRLATREMAAVAIQKSYRRFCDRSMFHTIVADVITAQSIVRRWRAMRQTVVLRQIQQAKEIHAATKIRAKYVGYTARRKYLVCVNKVVQELQQAATKIKSAITIQATFRMYRASKKAIFMLSKVILCQSVIRGKIASVRFNALLAQREMAAISVQKTYRGFSEREMYHSIVADVITIQSIVRRRRATRQLKILKQIQRIKMVDAATKLRAAYVGYTARKNYLLAVNCVVTCQRAARRMMAIRELRELQGATLIQATWRRRLASKQEMAAVSIQKTFRGFRERLMYRVLISDVITTQSIVRRWSVIRQLYILRQIEIARKYNAATKIRAAYLGYTARISFAVVIKSVISLQCAGRTIKAKNMCQEIRRGVAAVSIQKSFRGFSDRLKYQVMVAVFVIKQYEEQRRAQQEWAAMITLQCAVRTMIAKTELSVRRQVRLAKEDNAAKQIRATYIGYITRKKYLITACALRIERMAARKIQATYRGYIVRLDYLIDLFLIKKRRLEEAQSIRLTKELAAVTKIQSAWRAYKAPMSILGVNDIGRVCTMFGAENTMDVECVITFPITLSQRKIKKDVIPCGENYSKNIAATTIVSGYVCVIF